MGSWKLNASNPGQYYYNIFYSGAGDEDITVTIPYPWVTQGAMPIHVYDNVTFAKNSSGQTCLTPGNTLAAYPDQITLASYGDESPPSYDFTRTTTVTVHVPALGGPSSFAYINIHLDYGLKGTTGYAKDGNNNAVQSGTTTVLIPDQQTYDFTDTTDGIVTITSTNAFKKDPGIGGLVLNGNGDPKVNVKVQIYQGTSSKPKATLYTDEDGWYMWQYKYTGKPTEFTVKLPTYDLSETILMKSNHFVVIDFTVP
jgi:hypothetical protein